MATMRLEGCRSGGRWQTHSLSHFLRVGTAEVAAGYDICHLVYRPIRIYSLSTMYRQVERTFALNVKKKQEYLLSLG